MDDFTVYKITNDVTWYRCTNCGYLTRGKPSVCPLCEGKEKDNNSAENSELAEQVLDNAIERIKAIMKKYQGGT